MLLNVVIIWLKVCLFYVHIRISQAILPWIVVGCAILFRGFLFPSDEAERNNMNDTDASGSIDESEKGMSSFLSSVLLQFHHLWLYDHPEVPRAVEGS